MSLIQSNQRIFISKNSDELIVLHNYCREKNYLLLAHSFLQFAAKPFYPPTNYQAVFFASPRAVHFFTLSEDCTDKRIAVAGDGTKKAVEQLGLTTDFCPSNSGNVTESAQAFTQWLGSDKVIFPCSDISNKSYAQFLKPTQFEFIEVYKTQISTEKIENCDVYVFTSPSNLTGFIQSNTLPDEAIVLAYGESTFNKFQALHLLNECHQLQLSSEEAVIEWLKEMV